MARLKRIVRPSSRYGKKSSLPPMTRQLAESVEASERAVDAVMAATSDRIRDHLEQIGSRPLQESDAPALLETVYAALDATYGTTPERADAALLGATIRAEAHNARKRAAVEVVRQNMAPALRRDPELRAVMGISRARLEEELKG